MRWAFLFVLIAAMQTSRRADACSCGFSEPTVSPPDGAIDVPLNARIIVQFAYALDASVELRNATTGELVATQDELRRPSGTYVPTIFATPVALLAPNTAYRITAKYDPWPEVTTMFSTGTAIDDVPPAFTGLTAMQPETMRYPVPDENGVICISSCIGAGAGHISRIRLDYPELPADAVHVALELYRPGESAYDEIPLPKYQPHILGYESCVSQSPILAPGAEYCGRLVAYDVAGNRSGDASEICVAAKICAPLTAGATPPGNCVPSDECRPIEEATQSTGCATTRELDALALLLLVLLRRRR